jgi:putative transposase
MGRASEISIGEFYHIYNRGTEKRTIFQSKTDYERFLALLYLCNNAEAVDLKLQGKILADVVKVSRKTPLVELCAYALMPNHYHLLIRESREGGISKFMQKVSTAYTMYFNKKNDRSGSLFQGKFKSEHAHTDEYLKYLISYIHLNPIKLLAPEWKVKGLSNIEKAEAFLGAYKYSSFVDFLGNERLERSILKRDALPEYFISNTDFEMTHKEWLQYRSV